ncbi:hypothetical protein ACHAXA_007775 [Cyclostephanos tholiformis]|uniref:Uncharacterized protein n=1 Tax=Cyclostephanos tholiformis TaxID=382380 RepID=A0ABD3RPF4_9STRA
MTTDGDDRDDDGTAVADSVIVPSAIPSTTSNGTTTTSSPSTIFVMNAESKRVLLERLDAEIASRMIVTPSRRSTSLRDNCRRYSRKRRRRNDDRDGISSSAEAAVAAGREKCEGMRTDVGGESIDDDDDVAKAAAIETSSVVRSRYVVGMNQCTRMLEDAYRHRCILRSSMGKEVSASTSPSVPPSISSVVPSLILLARDVRPAYLLSHVYAYAIAMNVPTLILPGGRASYELGMASGGLRCASMAMLLPPPPPPSSTSPSPPSSLDVEGDATTSTSMSTSGDRARGEEMRWMWRKRANADVDSFVRYALSKIPR